MSPSFVLYFIRGKPEIKYLAAFGKVVDLAPVYRADE